MYISFFLARSHKFGRQGQAGYDDDDYDNEAGDYSSNSAHYADLDNDDQDYSDEDESDEESEEETSNEEEEEEKPQ